MLWFPMFYVSEVVVSHVLCQYMLWFLMFYVSASCGFSCFMSVNVVVSHVLSFS